MDVKGDQPKHVGVLMRAANGDLWVLRDDDDAPWQIEDQDLVGRLNKLLPEGPDEQLFTFPLPQKVFDELNKADFGPLFWCWTLCSPSRLR